MAHNSSRTALAGAAVAAALGLAGVAQAQVIELELFGDSTLESELTNVYLLGRFTETGFPLADLALGGWSRGAMTPGVNDILQATSVSSFEGGIETAHYTVIGLTAANDVSLTLATGSHTLGITIWDDLFTTSESTIVGWLLGDERAELYSWFNNEIVLPGHGVGMGIRDVQVALTPRTTQGTSLVDYRVIPAPGTISAVLMCGLVLGRRGR